MIFWGEEAVFIIVGRDGDLFVCQRLDEFRLSSIWYKECICRDSNTVICDLERHDKSTISGLEYAH